MMMQSSPSRVMKLGLVRKGIRDPGGNEFYREIGEWRKHFLIEDGVVDSAVFKAFDHVQI